MIGGDWAPRGGVVLVVLLWPAVGDTVYLIVRGKVSVWKQPTCGAASEDDAGQCTGSIAPTAVGRRGGQLFSAAFLAGAMVFTLVLPHGACVVAWLSECVCFQSPSYPLHGIQCLHGAHSGIHASRSNAASWHAVNNPQVR
jgi:hypothetical protein